mgnify:CR=1 FL=1|jgi:hypothetical protein
MINELLVYDFTSVFIYKKEYTKKVYPLDFNCFNHDNYKKDKVSKNKLESNYYGKKRRNYTDYC